MAGIIPKTQTFLEDVREQMQKVTWPDWPQLKNSTFVIIVFVIILAIVIFGIDFLVTAVLNLIHSLAGA
ncbi:MAG: preprotein translocase subunit SecE [Gemmatimonadetes bacterium]|jgi:preprotein translocase subunit SecE|nr:preprotein translocase subunit SecE [Gemmatimonadota bacterium]